MAKERFKWVGLSSKALLKFPTVQNSSILLMQPCTELLGGTFSISKCAQNSFSTALNDPVCQYFFRLNLCAEGSTEVSVASKDTHLPFVKEFG